jgi:hypothetical protein
MRALARLAPLAAIGLCLASAIPARAAAIDFFDRSTPGAPDVGVSLSGLTGATTMTSTLVGGTLQPGGKGDAFVTTVSFGNLSGPRALLGDVALILPGSEEMTGGGKGVADVLRVFEFGASGLEVVYISNEGGFGLPNPGFNPKNMVVNTGEFCRATPSDGPPCPPGKATNEFVESSGLRTLFAEPVVLPAPNGPVDLSVAVALPTPATWTLVATGLAALGLMSLRRRRRSSQPA